MDTFSILLLLLAASYAVLLGSAAAGLVKVLRRPDWRADRTGARVPGLPHVTVIIPARNEQTAIGPCLDSILANDYPAARFEIVVVDDGSTDRTASIVRGYSQKKAVAAGEFEQHDEFESTDASVRLICIPDDVERQSAHKKIALARGVAESNGEIILTTDADCLVPPTWIRTMTGCFQRDTGVVTGAVLYEDDGSIFGRVQALEFLGLVALGAGFVGIGRPHLCNSANLAYRRRAYEDVRGYDGIEDVSTGDDEMLLHKIAYGSPWEVETCMEDAAAVKTPSSAGIREFFAQRTRWASAHARYPQRHLTVVSVLCYLFFAGLAAAALLGRWELLAAALVLKVAAEVAVLGPAARRFGRTRQLPLLLPAQLLHIPYILIVGLAGTFGGYEWKGRRLAR